MVVLLLKELEDQGYEERRRDPDDRRRHWVQIASMRGELRTGSGPPRASG